MNKYINWATVFLFQITGAIYAIYGLLNRISRLVNPLVVNSVFSETVESSVRGTTFLMDAAFSFLALGFALLYVPFEFLHFIYLCKLPKYFPTHNPFVNMWWPFPCRAYVISKKSKTERNTETEAEKQPEKQLEEITRFWTVSKFSFTKQFVVTFRQEEYHPTMEPSHLCR